MPGHQSLRLTWFEGASKSTLISQCVKPGLQTALQQDVLLISTLISGAIFSAVSGLAFVPKPDEPEPKRL